MVSLFLTIAPYFFGKKITFRSVHQSSGPHSEKTETAAWPHFLSIVGFLGNSSLMICVYIYMYTYIHTYIYVYISIYIHIYNIYYALMCAKVPVTVFDINMSIYHLLLLLLWAAIVLVVLGVDIAHPLLNQVIVVSSCRVLSCTTGSGFSTHLAASLHVWKISKCGSSPTFSSDFGI